MWKLKWQLYRIVMRLAHRFNWHYAPPIYPDGDTQLWCQWCGFRQTIKRWNEINQERSPQGVDGTVRSTIAAKDGTSVPLIKEYAGIPQRATRINFAAAGGRGSAGPHAAAPGGRPMGAARPEEANE